MSSKSLVLNKVIEIRQSIDVLVAGGGPAGMAAAVTAAKQGKKVMIIEAMNCLGGMGTAGMLPVFMPFGDKTNFYADGFGREVYDRMLKNNGFIPNSEWERCPQFKLEVLKRLYDDMIIEQKIKLSLITQVIDVKKSGKNKVSHVICASKSGIFAVAAKIFIDCTGDGDLAAMAGATVKIGDEKENTMAGTLCSIWAGINWKKVYAAKQDPEKVLLTVLKKYPKYFSKQDGHLPGILETGPDIGGGNVGHLFGVDGTDERSITKELISARKALVEYEKFYKKFIKGYERSTIVTTAPLVGIRESRRIIGDYILNINDFNKRASFEDEIGRYNYWIDMHSVAPSLKVFEKHLKLRKTMHMQEGESYGIPYRILTPRGLDNVLVAGRCVSTDKAVQASIRVMPSCFITGQAAGMAAGIAVDNNTAVRKIPIKALQSNLISIGAFI